LWLPGEQRLQIFPGGAFTTLKLSGAKELSDISGMVFDQHGNLAHGVLRNVLNGLPKLAA
jgi:hypothetical protein